MGLLEIHGLSHRFGDHVLFNNTDFSLDKGEHIGIVGANGVGKSTLIKICTKQIIPDDGTVIWEKGISIGYLDQYAEVDGNLTIRQFLQSAFEDLYKTENTLNDLYFQISKGNQRLLNRAAYLQEILENSEFYYIDNKIEQIANGLGISAIGLDKSINRISGGQRAKVILAKLLLEKADVLLLDEPTNFLDKEHIKWLAEYLSTIDNAFLVISHDSTFLEAISNRICDIDNKTIKKYYGTFSQFLRKKEFLREDYIRKYSAQQKKIKETEEFIRKNKAGRKSKMARGRQKQLDRMEKMEALNIKEIKPEFRFLECPYTTTEHLRIKKLSIGYYYPLISDISFSITGGQKVVLTGFNGIGKSTLLKTLMQEILPLSGKFQFSSQVKIQYYEQDLRWPETKMTPYEIVSTRFPSLTQKEIRQKLAKCGVLREHVLQEIGTLSGGEQAKVKLCLIMNEKCNFIIMDEPTNHLDVLAKEALQEALRSFNGTVLLVSHEEKFYKDWVDKIINVEKMI